MKTSHTAYVRLNLQYLPMGRAHTWAPAMNAFCCEERIVLCFELAGVDKETIDVLAEPRRLRVRGVRAAPEPPQCEGPFAQILALEIDHGPFEREITLPVDIDPAAVRAEQRNGLLWVQLPVRRES